MIELAIVDTGCANLASVMFAFQRIGVEGTITSDPADIVGAQRVVLPGVGTAAAGMKGILDKGLGETLAHLWQPVLGICLGMQIMADRSTETNTDGSVVDGLGVIRGEIGLLSTEESTVLPHMGWNTVSVVQQSQLFDAVDRGSMFYFVHSFALPRTDDTIAVCDYGSEFSAAVKKDNYFGVQFHPELSGAAGSRVLSNFVEMEL